MHSPGCTPTHHRHEDWSSRGPVEYMHSPATRAVSKSLTERVFCEVNLLHDGGSHQQSLWAGTPGLSAQHANFRCRSPSHHWLRCGVGWMTFPARQCLTCVWCSSPGRSYRALYILNWIYRFATEPNYRQWLGGSRARQFDCCVKGIDEWYAHTETGLTQRRVKLLCVKT